MKDLTQIQSKALAIRAFLFDVDGVLTDGGIIINNDGIESKQFDIKDGFAISRLQRLGFVSGIITGRRSEVVEMRARELSVMWLRQGVLEKRVAYEEFKKQFNLHDEEIAYIGDDLIDLPILLRCGLSASPADGVAEVVARVDIVMHKNGGRGAVREFIELVLKAQGRWSELVEHYIKESE
ncbi:MAG: HAD hydrolase family protein [Campylobacterales bacterium]